MRCKLIWYIELTDFCILAAVLEFSSQLYLNHATYRTISEHPTRNVHVSPNAQTFHSSLTLCSAPPSFPPPLNPAAHAATSAPPAVKETAIAPPANASRALRPSPRAASKSGFTVYHPFSMLMMSALGVGTRARSAQTARTAHVLVAHAKDAPTRLSQSLPAASKSPAIPSFRFRS
jgi:hypothetical protein